MSHPIDGNRPTTSFQPSAGTSAPATAKQTTRTDKAPPTAAELAAARADLDRALGAPKGELNVYATGLDQSMEVHQSLYEKLSRMSSRDLTPEMQQVLDAFDSAGRTLAQTGCQIMEAALGGDLKAIMDAMSLVSTLNRSGNDDMQVFTNLVMKTLNDMYLQNTSLMLMQAEARQEMMMKAAQEIRSAAEEMLKHELVGAGLSMAAGAISMGMGMAAAKAEYDASQAEARGQKMIEKGTEMLPKEGQVPAEGTDAPTDAQVEGLPNKDAPELTSEGNLPDDTELTDFDQLEPGSTSTDEVDLDPGKPAPEKLTPEQQAAKKEADAKKAAKDAEKAERSKKLIKDGEWEIKKEPEYKRMAAEFDAIARFIGGTGGTLSQVLSAIGKTKSAEHEANQAEFTALGSRLEAQYSMSQSFGQNTQQTLGGVIQEQSGVNQDQKAVDKSSWNPA